MIYPIFRPAKIGKRSFPWELRLIYDRHKNTLILFVSPLVRKRRQAINSSPSNRHCLGDRPSSSQDQAINLTSYQCKQKIGLFEVRELSYCFLLGQSRISDLGKISCLGEGKILNLKPETLCPVSWGCRIPPLTSVLDI